MQNLQHMQNMHNLKKKDAKCARDAYYAECKTRPITIDSKTTLLNQTFQTKAKQPKLTKPTKP